MSKLIVKTVSRHLQTYECWLIFVVCAVIYQLNNRVIAAGDSVPNSLLALNWLFNGSLDFDNFRNSHYYSNGQLPWFFTEAKYGQLTSIYPIGTAIVSFPIYVCFYLFLLITQQAQSIDITSSAFVESRLLFERIAAAMIASLAVVLFYQASRLKFSRAIALITTFIYAFATQLWVIGSQALWQHGVTNLLLVAVFLCLLKANRSEGVKQTLFILNSGILCGLLVCIRPTNSAFAAAAGVYVLWLYRRQAVFFALGSLSALIGLGWNLYFFGSLIGGYRIATTIYHFSPKQFLLGLSGLLLSPNRGLLIYTPILGLAIPGIVQVLRQSRCRDEKLMILLLGSSSVIFLQYCFFQEWWGGGAYGPRFLTDILPMLCFSVNYAIAQYLKQSEQLGHTLLHWKVLGVIGLLSISVFVQIVGAFGYCDWDGSPIPLSNSEAEPAARDTQTKLWQIRDSQIERSFHSALFRIDPPTLKPNYVKGLAGKILLLRDEKKQPFSTGILTQVRGTKMRVYATVQNTGTSQWYGYQTGAAYFGETRLRVGVFDGLGKVVNEQRLFVSGTAKPGESAIAIGDIVIPYQPGRYKLNFELIAETMTTIPLEQGKSEKSNASLIVDVPQLERGV